MKLAAILFFSRRCLRRASRAPGPPTTATTRAAASARWRRSASRTSTAWRSTGSSASATSARSAAWGIRRSNRPRCSSTGSSTSPFPITCGRSMRARAKRSGITDGSITAATWWATAAWACITTGCISWLPTAGSSRSTPKTARSAGVRRWRTRNCNTSPPWPP